MSIRCQPGSFAYTIKAGDTLFQLARTYGTTVNAIIAVNPGINPTALRVGQTICIPGTAPVACPDGSFTYVIQRGDNLFAIARRYGTTVSAITAVNPGINPNMLQIGQAICIPGEPSVVCSEGSFSYTIQRGDSLNALAQRFGTNPSAIITLNPGLDPGSLQVGRIICIPGAAPRECPSGSSSYVIRSGDTLYVLAQRFGTTVAAIVALNPGINPNALQVGETICIPQAGPTCVGGNFYTIQTGDTLFLIATRFDISVAALRAANPGLDPNRLVPGQRICIPGAQSITCPGDNTYLIGPGETLSSIAEKFTVSAADILILNPGLRPSDFTQGRRICIPTGQAPV